jgi:hypothetical protein
MCNILDDRHLNSTVQAALQSFLCKYIHFCVGSEHNLNEYSMLLNIHYNME